MKPLLSLITGKVERDASFARLVRSIAKQTAVTWELVVSDASTVPFASEWAHIRVIHESPRRGCVEGYNAAFREARGEWVIFLNDDAEVTEGYADAAISFMEAHPHIGLGCLHYAESGGPFHFNSAWDVPYANFGILKRSLGDQVGWMDTDLAMYGNDNSLTFRVLLAGYGVADIPDARIIHHSVQDHIRADNQRHKMRDNHILVEKYWPYREQWLSTYRKFRIESDRKAWSHGVPEAVGKGSCP